MKNKILTILLSGIVALSFVGCGVQTYQEAINATESTVDFADGYFTVIMQWGNIPTYRIVYAKDTKVKYFVFFDGYRCGITPLYNADGTLQIYEENSNESR